MLSINVKGQLMHFDSPKVMGIINATPDSFHTGSRTVSIDAAVSLAEKMLYDGASILDVGGQSTRPGSEIVSAADELARVIPVVEAIAMRFPEAIISIDTFYSGVAKAAVESGAAIVNDVSAGSMDADLIDTVASLNVPYILMHMQGIPATMQQLPHYNNVVIEVFDALHFKLQEIVSAGIKDVIVDPGFGFGKTIQHNFQLLNELSFFQQLQKPILVGISRKGTIYKTLGTTADKALNGTTVLNTVALLQGAHILRVHDVAEAVEAIKLLQAVKGNA